MLRFLGADLFQGFEFLSFQLIIVDEEIFQIVGDLFGQVGHFFDVLEDIGTFGNGEEPIIPDHLLAALFFGLFGCDAADDAAFDDDARKTIEFGNDDHVEGVAVLPFCLRDKSEVVGKDHPGREDLAQFKEGGVGNVVVFLGASFGGLDYDVNVDGHGV